MRLPDPASAASLLEDDNSPGSLRAGGFSGVCMAWPDHQTELLRRYWREGLSASKIAGRIGGVTRNAVIGKAHRLGLPERGQSSPTACKNRSIAMTLKRQSQKSTRERVKTVVAKIDFDAEPLPADDPSDTARTRVTFSKLEPHHCRFPIGDPKSADFGFCGCNKVHGLPYCEAHARRAYQPPKARIRDETTFIAPSAEMRRYRKLVDA